MLPLVKVARTFFTSLPAEVLPRKAVVVKPDIEIRRDPIVPPAKWCDALFWKRQNTGTSLTRIVAPLSTRLAASDANQDSVWWEAAFASVPKMVRGQVQKPNAKVSHHATAISLLIVALLIFKFCSENLFSASSASLWQNGMYQRETDVRRRMRFLLLTRLQSRRFTETNVFTDRTLGRTTRLL